MATEAAVGDGTPLDEWLIDWPEFWDTDHKAEDFLCAPLLARGRGHALYAKAKTGKSLIVLEMAAALATGRPFLGYPGGDPVKVLYIDYEMAPGDLAERLEVFGYDSGDDLDHLRYVQLPAIEPLDTASGGSQVVQSAIEWGVELVVVDTFARSVKGEENAMETARDFFRHTGSRLKREGITTMRVDHAGKDIERGQRGSSAKNDDVDIVWELAVKGGDDSDNQVLTLKATYRRMGWVPALVEITRTDDSPMHVYTTGDHVWIEGVKELGEELDRLKVPIDMGRRKARDNYGVKANDRLWGDTKRWRKQQQITAFLRSQAHNVVPAPPQAPVLSTTHGHHLEPLDKTAGQSPIGGAGTTQHHPTPDTQHQVPPLKGEPVQSPADIDDEGLI